MIRFTVTPYKIEDRTIVRLPQSASAQLPSRGMVMVNADADGRSFQIPLEPDGLGGHWFEADMRLAKHGSEAVTLEVEVAKEWSRPDMPADIMQGLAKVPEAAALWEKITPAAQWEWLRWIRATNRSETRQRRIEVASSKLKSGMRRPCCFNRNMCTDPAVSRNGVLLEPAATV